MSKVERKFRLTVIEQYWEHKTQLEVNKIIKRLMKANIGYYKVEVER